MNKAIELQAADQPPRDAAVGITTHAGNQSAVGSCGTQGIADEPLQIGPARNVWETDEIISI